MRNRLADDMQLTWGDTPFELGLIRRQCRLGLRTIFCILKSLCMSAEEM